MSNHFSADDLKAPGDDRRLDITDVFCFKSSKDPDRIMLILCSNSTAPAPAPTCWYATGEAARQPEPAGQMLAEGFPVRFDGMTPPIQAGPVRLLAGRRSDPFFADLEGTLHGFAWTGLDNFIGNVSAIVLEVPAGMLFAGPQIGVWATISRRRPDGSLEQMDRGGNPTLNPFINPDGEKDLYNSRQPADDVANYLGRWSQVLEKAGYP